jgi:hypothetical protein
MGRTRRFRHTFAQCSSAVSDAKIAESADFGKFVAHPGIEHLLGRSSGHLLKLDPHRDRLKQGRGDRVKK